MQSPIHVWGLLSMTAGIFEFAIPILRLLYEKALYARHLTPDFQIRAIKSFLEPDNFEALNRSKIHKLMKCTVIV